MNFTLSQFLLQEQKHPLQADSSHFSQYQHFVTALQFKHQSVFNPEGDERKRQVPQP